MIGIIIGSVIVFASGMLGMILDHKGILKKHSAFWLLGLVSGNIATATALILELQ